MSCSPKIYDTTVNPVQKNPTLKINALVLSETFDQLVLGSLHLQVQREPGDFSGNTQKFTHILYVYTHTNLQHPGGHHPAHERLDVLLYAFKIRALRQKPLLDGQKALQHPVIAEKVGVGTGSHGVRFQTIQLHCSLCALCLPLKHQKTGGAKGDCVEWHVKRV